MSMSTPGAAPSGASGAPDSRTPARAMSTPERPPILSRLEAAEQRIAELEQGLTTLSNDFGERITRLEGMVGNG